MLFRYQGCQLNVIRTSGAGLLVHRVEMVERQNFGACHLLIEYSTWEGKIGLL